MGEIYTDLNSDFPLKVSTMNRVQDVTLSAKPYVDLYNQYYSQGDFDNANKVINDHPELLTMMLNMNMVNQIIDEIKATQRTFRDNVESYIFTIVKIKGQYSGSAKYTKYNIVYYNNQPYMNIADDTPISTLPTNIVYWYPLAIKGEQGESGLGLTPRGYWNDNTQYYKDDMVAYNNVLWAALSDNQNYIPNESSSVWLKMLAFSSEYLTYDNSQSGLTATSMQGAIDEIYKKANDGLKNLKNEIDNKSPLDHNHDDMYYTETEMNGLLNNKANAVHTHDDRYYTEAETNNLLGGKANSVHTHTANQISGLPTSLPANGGNSNTVGGYGISRGVVAGQFGLRVTQFSNVDIGVGAGLTAGELYFVYE